MLTSATLKLDRDHVRSAKRSVGLGATLQRRTTARKSTSGGGAKSGVERATGIATGIATTTKTKTGRGGAGGEARTTTGASAHGGPRVGGRTGQRAGAPRRGQLRRSSGLSATRIRARRVRLRLRVPRWAQLCLPSTTSRLAAKRESLLHFLSQEEGQARLARRTSTVWQSRTEFFASYSRQRDCERRGKAVQA